MKNIIKVIFIVTAVIVSILLFYKPTSTVMVVEASTETETIHEPYNNEYTSIEETTEVTTAQLIIDTEWERLPLQKSYNTAVKSNATVDELNLLLQDSNLSGYGQFFKDIEDTYNVNAIFAISVAMNETTLGKYGVSQSYNNLFGLTNTSGSFIYFNDYDECIDYFGSYIKRVHHNNNRYYIGDIGPVYCDYEWVDKVEDIFETFYSELT